MCIIHIVRGRPARSRHRRGGDARNKRCQHSDGNLSRTGVEYYKQINFGSCPPPCNSLYEGSCSGLSGVQYGYAPTVAEWEQYPPLGSLDRKP